MNISGISGIGYPSTLAGSYAAVRAGSYAGALAGSYAASTNAISQLGSYPQTIGNYAQLAARADAASYAGNSLQVTIDQFQGRLAGQAGTDGGALFDQAQVYRLQGQVDNLVSQYNRMVRSAATIDAAGVNSALSLAGTADLAAAGVTRNPDDTYSFNQDALATAMNAEPAGEALAGILSGLAGFAADTGRAAATVLNEVQDLTASATTGISDLLQTAAREQLNQLALNSLASFSTIQNSVASSMYENSGSNSYFGASQSGVWPFNLTNLSGSSPASLFDFLGSNNSFNSIQLNQLMLSRLTAINNAATGNLLGIFGFGNNVNSTA